ncbi:hypothetical protein TD95_002005 [Thielaviopsis punctulata]|uniref:Peptidase S54 rhomboid domain-containing protein n=1 Tax=Thielaviopsis punctulata TaxID=72032 RepID=A0A0F4ZJU8_9PEZI|nr:hypothetical protein TD95_002005 [Thielaviopsis punctulata]
MSLFVFPVSSSSATTAVTAAGRLCLRSTFRAVSARPASESPGPRFFSSSTAAHFLSRRPAQHAPLLAPRLRWPAVTAPSALVQRRCLWGDNDVVVMYEMLPRDYKDAVGLPFRVTELSKAETLQIFGPKVPQDAANQLLRILHGRRVAGTLEDPAYRVNTAMYSAKTIAAGLEFLRKTVPVDETINAGLRAQDELEQLERQLAKEEKAKRASAAASASAAPALPEFDPADVEVKPDPVYGYSKFDQIRAHNKARAEVEKQRQEAEEAARPAPEPGTLQEYVQTGNLTVTSPQMKKWMQDAAVSDMEEAPETSKFTRVMPTVTLAALFLAGCVGFALVYEAPLPEARFFVDVRPATACVATIIALNTLVYAGWRIPPLWRFMNRYFIMVMGLPRPVSVILAPFSQNSLSHLIGNMATLYFFGPRLHDDLGRGNFLALYLGCGVMGYVASLLWHPVNVASLGASCAVFGVMSAYFWLHRFDCFKILNLPPDPMEGVPGLVFLAFVIALHLSAAMSSSKHVAKLDLASHWGGILSGIGGVQLMEYYGRTNGHRTKEGRFRRGPATENAAAEVLPSGFKKTESLEILTGEKAQ